VLFDSSPKLRRQFAGKGSSAGRLAVADALLASWSKGGPFETAPGHATAFGSCTSTLAARDILKPGLG